MMQILKVVRKLNAGFQIAAIFFVILETFLEAFCFFIIPVFAIFINSEFNFGKNFSASSFFLPSIRRFIFLRAFLNLLFLALFTAVCLEILLILLIAGSADATSQCTFAKDDDNYWSTSEEITISEGSDTNLCDGTNGGCSVDVTLTKIGVGNEDDKVIRTITAYADASN